MSKNFMNVIQEAKAYSKLSRDLEKFSQIILGREIKVHIKETDKGFSTDGKEIFLSPYLFSDEEKLLLNESEILALYFHELAHLIYSEFLTEDEKGNLCHPKQIAARKHHLLPIFCNAVEDIRVELKIKYRFPGAYERLRILNGYYLDKQINKESSKKKQIFLLTYLFPIYGKEYLADYFNPEILDDIEDVWGDKFDGLDKKTPKDSYHIAEQILNALIEKGYFEHNKKQEQNEEQEQYEGQEQEQYEEQERGQRQENKKNNDKKQNEEQEGEQTEEQKEYEEQEQEQVKELQELLQEMKNFGLRKRGEKEQLEMSSNVEKIGEILKEGDVQEFLNENKIEVIEAKDIFLNQIVIIKEIEQEEKEREFRKDELLENLGNKISRIIAELQSLFVTNRALRYNGHYRSGLKIDTRKMYRIPITDNPKPFRKKIKRDERDYCCLILLDISSSMLASAKTRKKEMPKIDYAIQALYLCSLLLERIGITHAIATFEGTKSSLNNIVLVERENKEKIKKKLNANSELKMKLYKLFDEAEDCCTIRKVKNFSKRLSEREKNKIVSIEAGGGTPTGMALLWAINKLQKRPEKEKLIVLITDGFTNDPEILTKQAVELAEKSGIEIACFGIESGSKKHGFKKDVLQYLEKYFANYIFIHVQELGPALLELFKKTYGT